MRKRILVYLFVFACCLAVSIFNRKSPAEIQPISFEKMTTPHVTLYDLSGKLDENQTGKIPCLKSKEIKVSVTLCLHDVSKDTFISRSIKTERVWEEPIMGK